MHANTGVETLDFRPSLKQTMVITEKSLLTDGRVSRVEIELEGDQTGPPAHIHPGQSEIYSVESGELTVTLDGEPHVIGPGRSIEIPSGSIHSFANRSNQSVRFSAEHLPALRFEEYIRLVHRTVAGQQISLPVILRVVRIESSYEDVIVPPPGIPRLVGKLMSGLGRLAGYPSGAELGPALP